MSASVLKVRGVFLAASLLCASFVAPFFVSLSVKLITEWVVFEGYYLFVFFVHFEGIGVIDSLFERKHFLGFSFAILFSGTDCQVFLFHFFLLL